MTRIVIATGIFGSIALGAVAAAWPLVIPLLLLGLLGIIAALVVRRFLAPSPLSPVWVTTAIYGGVALFGVLYPSALPVFPYGSGAYGNAARTLPPEVVGRTALLFLLAAVFVLLGASCYLVVTGNRRPKLAPTPVRWIASSTASNVLLLFAASVPLLLIVVGASHGIETLLHRPYYIDGRTDNKPLFALGGILALAAVTVSGYTCSTAKSWITRIGSIGVTLLYVAVFFSLATRTIALAPIGFAFGVYAANPTSRGSKLTVIVALGLSLFLLALPLYLRSSSDHGLLPYLQTLSGHDPSAAPVDRETVFLNVLSSFGLSGDVAFLEPSIPLSHLWPSVNPLPGSLTSWYQIQPSHRLDFYTPYSTIGELGNYGLPILAAYFWLAGVLLALFDTRARELVARGQHLYGLALAALGLLFPILSLQYQLRADTRILYYGLILLGISTLARVVGAAGGRFPATGSVARHPAPGSHASASSPEHAVGLARPGNP